VTDPAHVDPDRPDSPQPWPGRPASPAAQRTVGPQPARPRSGARPVHAAAPPTGGESGGESGSGPGLFPGPISASPGSRNPYPAPAALCPGSYSGPEHFPCFRGSLPDRPGVTPSVNEPDTAPCPAGSGFPLLSAAWSFPPPSGGFVTAADATGPHDHSDGDGGPGSTRLGIAHPREIDRPPAGYGRASQRRAAQDRPAAGPGGGEPQGGRVTASRSRLGSGSAGGRAGGARTRPGPRWVFHGEEETISGREADWIRAELADVIRDLLLWASGHGADEGTTGTEREAA